MAMAALAGGCGELNGRIAALFGAPAQPAPAPETAAAAAPSAPKADRVVVLKRRRLLELQRRGETVEQFAIALGPNSVGAKHQRGDERTPEGLYRIDWRTTDTPYTRELHISYPNDGDRAKVRAAHADPDGGIFIHGLPRDYGPYDPPIWVKDWTEGCIAVGNAAIAKIWDAVPDGTPIVIEP